MRPQVSSPAPIPPHLPLPTLILPPGRGRRNQAHRACAPSAVLHTAGAFGPGRAHRSLGHGGQRSRGSPISTPRKGAQRPQTGNPAGARSRQDPESLPSGIWRTLDASRASASTPAAHTPYSTSRRLRSRASRASTPTAILRSRASTPTAILRIAAPQCAAVGITSTVCAPQGVQNDTPYSTSRRLRSRASRASTPTAMLRSRALTPTAILRSRASTPGAILRIALPEYAAVGFRSGV